MYTISSNVLMKQANWIPLEKWTWACDQLKNLKNGQWKTYKKKQVNSMSCTPMPMIHSCATGQKSLPKTFCLSIVSNFSWGGCNTQEKWMQNFRGQKRCLMGDVQVTYSKLNTDCTCLRLWAHSTSTNIKRWTNGQMSQPKVIGCMDNHYFLPLVLHWVHFAHRRALLK